MKTPMEALQAFVDNNRQEMLLFWESLVNMQAGSKEVDKINRIIDFLKKHFEVEGISCRLVDSKGSSKVLVVELNPEAPGQPILLAGHCDTVFPSGSYPDDPFHIKDGFAYGPGVVDMKNGITQIFYILVALKQFGFTERPVKAVIVGDEESSHGAGITDQILMDEAKGCLCCLNMESGRMDNCLTVGRKGGMDCHLTVHGVAAHAGNDYLKGRNAIVEMSHKLPLLQDLTIYDEGLTVSVGVIKGGMVSNAVPDYCYAELDVRYKKLEHMEYIKEKIREVCSQTFIEGTTTEVEFVAPMPAFEETAANHRLLAYINSVATSYGYPAFAPIYVGGMSDAAYFGSVGVPTVCSMGGQGSGAHTKEERADVESFFRRWLIAMACIMEIENYVEKFAI
ncbi:MAG: M20 family metallopeptidase [Phascolarctobacterium sp.]